MIKTRLIAILLLGLFFSIKIYSQTSDKIMSYPKEYKIQTVDTLINLKDYQKAIWYTINIYGINKDEGIKLISKIKELQPDIQNSIKTAFASFSVFDPVISDLSKGGMNINTDKMKLKGSWGDELIREIK